jgi:hypothetical protein
MPIDSSKFSSNSLTGTVRVSNGFANIVLPTAFYALEGNITFNVSVRTDSTQGAVIYTSPTITLRDVSTFVSLTANTATVNEGDLVAFTLVTANALGNSTLYYSVSPVTANVTSADFVANTGSFYLTNNTGTFTLKANSDLSLVNETGENFRVQLRTVGTTGNVVYTSSNIAIADTSNAYNILGLISGSASPVVSGSNVTFTFSATNVPSGTLFYYSTSGNVSSFSSNTGSFALNSISNTFVITNPQVPFNASRSYNAIVRSGSASGPIVATSNAMVIMDDAALPLLGSGGTYTTANGYSINYFTTSGTLTFNKGATVEYVAISGGGGGYGGGGGAGRVYDSATNGLKTVVAGTPYTVTIGAGGNASGGTGGSTVFDSLTITGGNGGAVGAQSNGGAGGSSSQPFAGGAGSANTPFGMGGAGGGGGGSGGIGIAGTAAGPSSPTAASSIAGGAGGPGRTAIAIDGSTRLYGGGGGGGSMRGYRALGGSGGGGAGEQQAISGSFGSATTFLAGTSGNVNTGSGGGGNGETGGYAGGSGIVIVRYATPAVTFANLTTTSSFTYEGSNIVFTMNTTNVSNNTLLYYYTVGNVLTTDFVTGNTGSFRTTLNSTTITLPTNSTIPANEERFFQLRIAGDTGTSADPLITSNVFTVKGSELQPKATSIQYLVVAGGGGGGGQNGGGGGGAGGYLANSAYPITPATPYTITVGSGGGGGPGSIPAPYSNSPAGSNGSNSSIGAGVIAFGGGGGGAFYGQPAVHGNPGGSGGSPGFYNNPTATNQPYTGLATGSPGWNVAGIQGYPSGRAKNNPGGAAGGGGGAGGTGSDGGPSAGPGGIGLLNSISGTSMYYAGGGAGAGQGVYGTGGLGGGGNTGPQAGSTGTVNTGGGGGGSQDTGGSGSAGGSGIVVIRYPDTFATATTTGSPNVIYANANIIYRFWQSGSITFP